jgi:uncharacterized protein with PIN domain
MRDNIISIDEILDQTFAYTCGSLAFRTVHETGHRYRRKQMRCPYCGGRLSDAYVASKIEVITEPEQKGFSRAIFTQKCICCGKELGILLE